MDQILTPTQVAERLQVKPSWVYEQTRDRAEVRNPDPSRTSRWGAISDSIGKMYSIGSNAKKVVHNPANFNTRKRLKMARQQSGYIWKVRRSWYRRWREDVFENVRVVRKQVW